MTSLLDESRSAISRARLFLQLAEKCTIHERGHFEAFVEAAIVFSRAAVHRFKNENEAHPKWDIWWDCIAGNAAIKFFRAERNWILKEASSRIGQRGFAASVSSSGPTQSPTKATEMYFYETPSVSATATVERHLAALEQLLGNAQDLFDRL